MKILLLIAILFTVSVKGQTNVYHPFPDSEAVWNFSKIVRCGFHGWEFDYYSIQISGDTLINGLVYHKLSIPFIQHNTTNFCSEVTGYQGGVREDTSMKKVFYVLPNDTIEQLLYDFNMQVGDTVKGFVASFATETVQSIDSVLVGISYRKRWLINTGYGIHFIEGIGSVYGLVEFSPGNITDAPDYLLTCFQQNAQTLYPDTTAQCELINAISIPSEKPASVNISPNPFHTSSLLQVRSGFENSLIKIYSAIGLLVKVERISNQKIYVLNRSGLQNGIYFIQLISGSGQMITEKIVVE